jgi:hypothetical protein
MATTPISPNSLTIPQQTHATLTANNQTSKTTEPVLQRPKSDSISISKQAILMNSPNYSPAEEAAESSAEKSVEKMKGQR